MLMLVHRQRASRAARADSGGAQAGGGAADVGSGDDDAAAGGGGSGASSDSEDGGGEASGTPAVRYETSDGRLFDSEDAAVAHCAARPGAWIARQLTGAAAARAVAAARRAGLMAGARAARSKAARRELSEVVFHTMRQRLGAAGRGGGGGRASLCLWVQAACTAQPSLCA
jgi:hypothetical protein